MSDLTGAHSLEFVPVEGGPGTVTYDPQWRGCECPMTGKKSYELEIEWCDPSENAQLALKCTSCSLYAPLADYVVEHGGAVYTEVGIPVSINWCSTFGENYYDPSDGEIFGVIEAQDE